MKFLGVLIGLSIWNIIWAVGTNRSLTEAFKISYFQFVALAIYLLLP